MTAPVSGMPALDGVLSLNEVRDLVAWLATLEKGVAAVKAPEPKPLDISTIKPVVHAAGVDADVMALGKQQFAMCSACHGPNAEGGPIAPPLAKSNWVNGPVENLIRIQLRGLTGPLEALDHRGGLHQVFDPRLDFSRLWAPASGPPRILLSHVKTWPCIGTGQTAVGAAIELHPKLAGRTDSIEKIVVTMMDAPMIRDQQAEESRRLPRTHEDADHSFTFLPVVAMVDGDVGERQFEHERWMTPQIRGLIEKVDLRVSTLQTLYGESVVMNAVPAFMIMNGTFASLVSGAIAAAFGVHTTPVIMCTLSRTISSWARPRTAAARWRTSVSETPSAVCGLMSQRARRAASISATAPRSRSTRRSSSSRSVIC